LCPAEVDALETFAGLYGRTWKLHLREEWARACCGIWPLELRAILQQLRNDPGFGPSGLIAYQRKLDRPPTGRFQAQQPPLQNIPIRLPDPDPDPTNGADIDEAFDHDGGGD